MKECVVMMMKLERSFDIMFFISKYREISFGLGQLVPVLTNGVVHVQIHEINETNYSVRVVLSHATNESTDLHQTLLETQSCKTPKDAFKYFEKMMDHYSKPFQHREVAL